MVSSSDQWNLGLHTRSDASAGGNGSLSSSNYEGDHSNMVIARTLGILGLYGESLFICVSGVVVDSVIVERVQQREVGNDQLGQLQSMCALWRTLGVLSCSLLSGLLVDALGIPLVFFFTACLPLGAAGCALFLPDTSVYGSLPDQKGPEGLEGDSKGFITRIASQLKLIWDHLFVSHQLWKPALFILSLSCTPSAYTAFYYFLYYEVGVTASQFGVMSFLTSLASLLGKLFCSIEFGDFSLKGRNCDLRYFLPSCEHQSGIRSHSNTRILHPLDPRDSDYWV